jgi:hypothetical protein
MTTWLAPSQGTSSDPVPFQFQRDVAARLVAIGMDAGTAHRVADMIETGRAARNAHVIVDACDTAGARVLIPLFIQRGLPAVQAESLLRAAGAVDGRRLSPGAIEAVRESLLLPVEFERRAARSPYMESRHADR